MSADVLPWVITGIIMVFVMTLIIVFPSRQRDQINPAAVLARLAADRYDEDRRNRMAKEIIMKCTAKHMMDIDLTNREKNELMDAYNLLFTLGIPQSPPTRKI